jgi:hypothetical protein
MFSQCVFKMIVDLLFVSPEKPDSTLVFGHDLTSFWCSPSLIQSELPKKTVISSYRLGKPSNIRRSILLMYQPANRPGRR